MPTIVADRSSKKSGVTSSKIMADSGRRMDIFRDYRDLTAKGANDSQVPKCKCFVF